jgi:hypothetical protein
MEPYPFPPDPAVELDALHRAARFARSLGRHRLARRLEGRARLLDLRLMEEEAAALWGRPRGRPSASLR